MIFDAVLDALLDCLWFLEVADDDAVDPDDAVRVMDEVAARFADLPFADRHELTARILARASAEPNPVRREFLEGVPEAFGLTDPD